MAELLITATDTGVGKTTVAASLVRALRASGLRVGAMKPAESGCRREGSGELIPSDALLLQAAAGGEDGLELICPYRFEASLAPGIAAARAGQTIDWDRIASCLAELRDRHPDGVVVEGAGGLLAPMAPAYGRGHGTVLDLAEALGLEALLIARCGLGTINHTALSLLALETRGVPCKGVILNPTTAAEVEAAAANAEAIEGLCGVPILAILPYLPAPSEAERIERLTAWIASGRKLDLQAIIA